MTDRKIITTLIEPPIPVAGCGWCAFFADEGEHAFDYGWGETEEAAVADLKSKTEEE